MDFELIVSVRGPPKIWDCVLIPNFISASWWYFPKQLHCCAYLACNVSIYSLGILLELYCTLVWC